MRMPSVAAMASAARLLSCFTAPGAAAGTDDGGRTDLWDAVPNLGFQLIGGPPPAAPGPAEHGPDPNAEEPETGCARPCI
ncbi:MAG: hypothetical protein ACRD2T_16375 [Thermoanaerobaculia bacterium]